eukprot:g15157.t1
MVSQNLQSKAPKVKNFVRMINFELPELQDLLLETLGSQSTLRDQRRVDQRHLGAAKSSIESTACGVSEANPTTLAI